MFLHLEMLFYSPICMVNSFLEQTLAGVSARYFLQEATPQYISAMEATIPHSYNTDSSEQGNIVLSSQWIQSKCYSEGRYSFLLWKSDCFMLIIGYLHRDGREALLETCVGGNTFWWCWCRGQKRPYFTQCPSRSKYIKLKRLKTCFTPGYVWSKLNTSVHIKQCGVMKLSQLLERCSNSISAKAHKGDH